MDLCKFLIAELLHGNGQIHYNKYNTFFCNYLSGVYMKKICEHCGKEFEAKTSRQRFCCGPHYDVCVVCGREFEISTERLRERDRSRTCSRSCAIKLGHMTYKEKTGFDNPQSNPEVQNKIKKTSLERYGVDRPQKSKLIKEKT